MKSNHLARADFLRQLKQMTLALYELGDFTSDEPDRDLLSKKIEGFIEAGLLIEVVTRAEAQKAIDLCHIDVFGESRLERRERIQSGQSKPKVDDSEIDWGAFDSPSFDRAKK